MLACLYKSSKLLLMVHVLKLPSGVEEEAPPFSSNCYNLEAVPCLRDQICNNLSLPEEKKMKETNLIQKMKMGFLLPP